MASAGDEDEDPAALFRAAMRGVRPLAPAQASAPPATPAPRRPRRRAPAARAADAALVVAAAPDADVDSADSLSHRRPHVTPLELRRLRRGALLVEAEIDLHGLTGAQARPALARFLEAAIGRGLRCVRIVHGKGLRSGERGPVLKRAVAGMLLHSPAVAAFVSAPPAAGGTGATHVLLEIRQLRIRR